MQSGDGNNGRCRGETPAGPGLAVVISTRDRVTRLERLLASLSTEWNDLDEVVVIDNGSTDGTERLLKERAGALPQLRSLRWDQAGKAQALNQARQLVSAPLVAFLDDDVCVRRGWARAYLDAARTLPHPAFQGQILLPIDDPEEAEVARAWRCYRTLPRVVADSRERRTLIGANMAVRRHVLDSVGWFDPRLGPGASGLAEDAELAERIRDAFGAPSHVPDATVDHDLDPTRLTADYFRRYHARLGRSRFIQKRHSLFLRIVPNLIKAAVLSGISRPWNGARYHMRHLARFYHYREMLRMRLRHRSDDGTG